MEHIKQLWNHMAGLISVLYTPVLHNHTYIHTCLLVCLCLCLSVCLSVRLSVCLTVPNTNFITSLFVWLPQVLYRIKGKLLCDI